ncbi:aminoglycoside phosphotransferase family protein [Umezawaea sp. Da 62-37]|uniref:aminoglycoside phosphotransferase family protein n=1 Tax=Umezawaea sp. Da 62-37 TaxID=3075927 RepID=UPI0028F7171D|nr:aminoglycoside phosphotransferase family protein [Umezawaea sp. Da 62-37]WNV90092.1 aminoglycoside phosphotransferase family protein [Umezawaea sp. Da 62-37]
MREVIALVTVDGEYAGALGPFVVDSRWWNHVEPVVEHLERVLGVPTSVLRLVKGVGEFTRGGTTTYQVEAHGKPDLSALVAEPVHVFPDDPLRMPWAKPGGPAELVAWAEEHVTRTGEVRQVKTWNLSCVFRVETDAGRVWVKALPPFFAAEPVALRLVSALDPTLVPEVIAAAPLRVLMADAPGGPCWEPTAEQIRSVVPRLVRVQAALAGDRRPGLPEVPIWSSEVEGSRERAEALLTTGLPMTLLHGDFHPGNWQSDGTGHQVIDWADAHWGHPALDAARLWTFLAPEKRPLLAEVWTAAWLEHVPDGDPATALELAIPLVHVFNAVRYREFLANIEDSEQVYHLGDPEYEIRKAQAALS